MIRERPTGKIWRLCARLSGEGGEEIVKVVSFDRLSVLNLHYHQFTLEYFLDRMAELGIRNVELLGGHQGLWLDPKEFQDPEPVRRMLEERGLSCPVFTPQNCRFGYQYGAKEPELIEKTFGFFSSGIRLAAALGAKYMEANAGWGYWDEPEEDGIKRTVEMHRRLAEVAAEYGVTIVAESLRPQESKIGCRIDQMKEIFDGVGHENFKVMIDLTAMAVAGETIDQWFKVFGRENIAHAHFQDCSPYGHYIWGQGTRNLRRDLEEMVSHGYEGYFTQELTDPAYYFDPFKYDRINIRNLKMYTEEA